MFRPWPFVAALAFVPGCFLFDTAPPDDPGTVTPSAAGLKAFESEQEFQAYFSGQIVERNDQLAVFRGEEGSDDAAVDGSQGGATGNESDPSLPPQPGAPDAGAVADEDTADNSFSGTTIQEEGVDEADVVKTDGTYLYIISGEMLRIVRAHPSADLALVSEVPLEGYGREIYLRGDRIIAITATFGGFYYFGDDIALVDPALGDGTDGADGDREDLTLIAAPEDEYLYERPQTFVTIIDVSSREAPAVLSQTSFDGSQSSSRMIDGVLHLVISNYQDYYYDVMPLLGRPELEVAGDDVDEFVPQVRRIDDNGVETEAPLLTWQNLYRPIEPDGFGMVSVVSMDVEGDGEFSAVGVVAEPGLIYSSLQALYLTNTKYDFSSDGERETTNLYKLAYVDDGAVPVATGSVPGRILNQYSMGEYQGYLRVATTIGPTFSFLDGVQSDPTNSVFVLDEVDGELSVVGSVDDIAPRETIQSARFIGERGFVVTFEQIDPLFTLDLSDPTDPRVIGEIEVPGFSTFIVPMDENHLLTVGQYLPAPPAFGPWGVQLSIFDVTDFEQPIQSANVVIGGEDANGWSEALYDPKAFTYFAEAGLVALPVSLYDYYYLDGPVVSTEPDQPTSSDDATPPPDATTDEPSGVSEEPEVSEIADPFVPEGFDGLYLYRVSTDQGFDEVGRISTRFEEQGYYWGGSFTRGVIINEDVYAVTDLGVRTMPVDDMSSEPHELFLADPVSDGGGGVIVPEPGIPVEGEGSSSGGSSGAVEGADAG